MELFAVAACHGRMAGDMPDTRLWTRQSIIVATCLTCMAGSVLAAGYLLYRQTDRGLIHAMLTWSPSATDETNPYAPEVLGRGHEIVSELMEALKRKDLSPGHAGMIAGCLGHIGHPDALSPLLDHYLADTSG